MIKLDISELAQAELSQLLETSQIAQTKWAQEKQFFERLVGNPDFDTEHFQKLIRNVDMAFGKLNQVRGSLMPLPPSAPGRSNRNSNQGNNHALDEEQKVELLFNELCRFEKPYRELIEYRDKNTALGRIESTLIDSIKLLESSVIENTKKQVEGLVKVVTEDINVGIKNVIDLKAELGLEGEFGEKIKVELASAEAKERSFMKALVLSVILIPIAILIVQFVVNLEPSAKYVVQGSISFSLLCISYFFFSQYRTYMAIRLRYTHLDGFLGGGATFISQLLKSNDDELKSEVNRKLAELFMGLDDVLQMVQKTKHPTEITLDKAVTIFDKVSKLKGK